MTAGGWGRGAASACAAAAVVVCAVAVALGQTDGPTAGDIVERVLHANADAPKISSAAVAFKFRLNKPVTEKPDCEFAGKVSLQHGRNIVTIGQRTSGLTCWILNKVVIGQLFEGTEPPDQFLSRFEFAVLGRKVVDGRPFYLIRGTARSPKANPRGLIGWVDYERGLVTEGTIEYPWGNIDSAERYDRIGGAWVLAYQYLATTRFGASMEAEYSDFEFAQR